MHVFLLDHLFGVVHTQKIHNTYTGEPQRDQREWERERIMRTRKCNFMSLYAFLYLSHKGRHAHDTLQRTEQQKKTIHCLEKTKLKWVCVIFVRPVLYFNCIFFVYDRTIFILKFEYTSASSLACIRLIHPVYYYLLALLYYFPQNQMIPFWNALNSWMEHG